jgi:hypothetical protein
MQGVDGAHQAPRSLHEDSTAPEVPAGYGQGSRDDGAGLHAMDGRAGGPCQRFARNYATRNLAPPHTPIPSSAFHLGSSVAAQGSARRREPPAHRWHARGQGFKSPQLHPRSEARSGLGRPRIGRPGQQIGSNRRCAGRSVAHRSATVVVLAGVVSW